MGFCLLENHGDIQDIVHARDGLIGVHGAAVVLRLYGDDQPSVLGGGVNLHAGNMGELRAYRGIRARPGVNDGAGDIQDIAFNQMPLRIFSIPRH